MLDPNDGDSRLFVGIFALQAESNRGGTQIAIVFLHTFRNAIVQCCIGEGDTRRLLILRIHLDDHVSNQKRNADNYIWLAVE